MVHARLAPSFFHVMRPCPGSVQLCEIAPAMPETDEEAEGTAAHVVATSMAEGVKTWQVGDHFDSGVQTWTVDLDMLNGAKLFAATCNADRHTALRVEEPVTISAVHPEFCFGTPDAWWYDPARRLLRVFDYKYGHRFIEVFENDQTTGYAEGVIERLNLGFDQELTVEIYIVQPRSYHKDGPVRVWRTQRRGLHGITIQLHRSAEEALLAVPPTRTGPHCQDCRARAHCTTFTRSTDSIVDFSGTAELRDLPDEAIGSELRTVQAAIQRLEARETGLAQHAESRLRAGGSVPHFALEVGQSKLTWNDDVDIQEAAGMARLMGVDIRKPPALITPTQAVDSGLDPAVIAPYSSRKPGALRLTAINTTASKKVFAK